MLASAVLHASAGSVAEWSIAPVLKTGKGQPFVSSNLTASASNTNKPMISLAFLFLLSANVQINVQIIRPFWG